VAIIARRRLGLTVILMLSFLLIPTYSSGAEAPLSSPNRQILGLAGRMPSSLAQPGSGDASTMATDVQSAITVTNQWWTSHWSQYFTKTYNPPRIFGIYSDSNAPSCGTTREESDNAFYCRTGDFLAFGDRLLARGYQLGNNSLTYLVVAHEWGHAIQARLSKQLQSRAAELQADCFAGAVLYGAAQDGILRFDQGDEKAIVNNLTQLADDTTWTKTTDHGDAFQRIEAFDYGRKGGVKACLPIS